MAAKRTQIYLTEEQREKLDGLADRHDRSLAELVREAVDMFLGEQAPDPDSTLKATFGSAPDLDVPTRAEWSRRG
jgi:predicted transcriptional regulator